MIGVDVGAIRNIKTYLDQIDYDFLLCKLRGSDRHYVEPFTRRSPKTRQILALFGKKRSVALELLYYGDPLSESTVREHICDDVIGSLFQLGIVHSKGGFIQTAGYSIVSYRGQYFIVDLPHVNENCQNPNPITYLGTDSYMLAEFIPQCKCGSVLDICSGSGIQGILASAKSDAVVEVEINPEAVRTSQVNAILNECEDVVSVREGSLYDPIGDSMFDVIISNPPFLPIPIDLSFPLVGDGGEDGLAIVRPIVKGYKSHLNNGGCAYMVGETINRASNTVLEVMLKEELKLGFDVTLYLTHMIDTRTYLQSVAGLSKVTSKTQALPGIDGCDLEPPDSWGDSVVGIVGFLLKAVRRQNNLPSNFSVIDLSGGYNGRTVPTRRRGASISFKPLEQTHLVYDGNNYLCVLGEHGKSLFEACDGIKTLDEICEEIALRNKEDSLPMFDQRNTINQAVKTLYELGLLE